MTSQTEGDGISVPHIPLIPFDFMPAQQRPDFVLKAQLAMALFLRGNVLLDLLQVGLVNRKTGVPALPLEIGVVRPSVLESEIGHAL